MKRLIIFLLLPLGLVSQTVSIQSGATMVIDGDGSAGTSLDCDGTVHIFESNQSVERIPLILSSTIRT